MVISESNATSKREQPSGHYETEERYAEAITVLWMLAAVATLAAELVSLGSRALLASTDRAAGMIGPIVPRWFAFCALVTGTVCLLLTPLAWWVRRQKPPLSVTALAVAISLLPWLLYALEILVSSNR